MQRLLFLIILFFSLLSGFCQDYRPIHLKGNVVDFKGEPIPYTNILVLNKHSGIATDYSGEFNISVEKNDTLLFTAIGYKDVKHIIPDTILTVVYHLTVQMVTDTILLQKAIVYPWPATEKLLVKEYLELELPDNDINLRLPKNYGHVNRTSEGFVGITMPGPAQILYDLFSREAKNRRLYESIVNKDREERYIASRLSKSLIEKITGLKDPEEIEGFLKFCNLSYKYVLASTDYEIALRIKNCYTQYIKLTE